MDASIRQSLRPWYTTGIALVGASAIAIAPVSPIAPPALTANVQAAAKAVTAEFELSALDIPYIITLPIVRQYIRNWAQNWAVYLGGLAQSGVGIAQSLLSIPGVTVEIIREVLELNFVGAFETFTTAVRDSVVAIGQPLLDSLIWRNQKFYAVQTALEAAVPQAIIDSVNGFLYAGNVITTSLIQGTQDLVAAVLTFDLGNIVDAAVDGTRNFFAAVGDGAGAIVDGIEAAQFGIATALATEPPSTLVSDVGQLRNFGGDSTITLADDTSGAGVDPDANADLADETPDPAPETVGLVEQVQAPEPPAPPVDLAPAPVSTPLDELVKLPKKVYVRVGHALDLEQVGDPKDVTLKQGTVEKDQPEQAESVVDEPKTEPNDDPKDEPKKDEPKKPSDDE